MWRTARRWLYLVHRWMGIAGCLLIAMWFGSGVVMMYVGFPALTPEERLAGLADIDPAGVRVTPDAAMAAAGLVTFPRSLKLEMDGDAPVYRMVDADGHPHAVSAFDGGIIGEVDAATAVATARRFGEVSGRLTGGSGESGSSGGVHDRNAARWTGTMERDQWTVHPGLDPWRPLHRIALDDGNGTELYVSAKTGEVVRDTSRVERLWNWVGAVPHWLYFTPIRQDTPRWRQFVLWTSGACVVVSISGIWIGLLRLRPRQRFSHGSVGGMSPYRGWMAWHHITGLAGALFLLAWLVSGWLSVNPNQWFDNRGFDADALQRYAGHPAPTFPEPAWRPLVAGNPGAREVQMFWVGGRPAMLLTSAAGTSRLVDPATGTAMAWTPKQLIDAAGALVPRAAIRQAVLQHDEDRYWYSHHQTRTLPVLHVRFADDSETSAYIDPHSGHMVGRTVDSRRLYRWLFHAPHSWDLRWLLAHRPAWDLWVCCLSVLGLVLSISGVVVGWRRLRRAVRVR